MGAGTVRTGAETARPAVGEQAHGARRYRPSPALVISMLALTVALAGTAAGGGGDRGDRTPARFTSGDIAELLKKLNGKITTKQLATGAVRPADLGLNAVQQQHMSPAAVTNVALADNAVNNAKLALGAVLAPNLGDNAVTNVKLASDAVTGGKIAPSAIQEQHMSAAAVTAPKLANDAVTGQKLAPGSVGSSALLDGAVIQAKIASAAVGAINLSSNAVTGPKIANGAVGTTAIAAANPAVGAEHSQTQQMPHPINFSRPAGCDNDVLGCPVLFDTELYDSANLHSTSTNIQQFRAPVAGVYKVEVSATWDADPDGFRQLTLFKNGVPFAQNTVPPAFSTAGAVTTHQTLTTVEKLAANDVVIVKGAAWQSNCSPNCTGQTLGLSNPLLTMTWLQPGG